MIVRTGKRILLAWWGTSKWGSPTIGDHMAISNIALALQQSGAEVDVASHNHVECGNANIVKWMRINPRAYKCVTFVCGPLSNELYFRLFFFRFRHARKVAVGVSVIDPTLPGTRLFEEIIARDGMPGSIFDLALATAPSQPIVQRPRRHIAVCLRGHQSEYGEENCHSAAVDRMVLEVARQFGDVEHIDTIIGEGNSIQQVHQSFADAKLVITTRLHGGLLALHHCTPFIAIDQIKGGRKVSSVLRRVPWDYLYPFDVDQATLKKACGEIISTPGIIHSVRNASQSARELSHRGLRRAVDAILDRSERRVEIDASVSATLQANSSSARM
jgi:hypothetical protein